jgi:hypothetical protein
LGPGPQFEVRRAVVVLNAVDVVNGFALDEVPAEDLLGDEDVLEDISAAGARMTWNTHHDVARLVSRFAASPVPVLRASLASARAARRGLDLLFVAAEAEISTSTRWATTMPARRLKRPSALYANALLHDTEGNKRV